VIGKFDGGWQSDGRYEERGKGVEEERVKETYDVHLQSNFPTFSFHFFFLFSFFPLLAISHLSNNVTTLQ